MLRSVIFTVIAIIFSSKFAFGAESSTTPVDYPLYVFSYQVGGSAPSEPIISNEFGRIDAKANQFGSFHWVQLDPHVTFKDEIGFKYRCVFINNANQIVITPTYESFSPCPPGKSSESRFIRAISVELTGPDRDLYRLEYECWIGYFKQYRLDYFGRVEQGNLCGREAGGAPQEWISRIVFYVWRK